MAQMQEFPKMVYGPDGQQQVIEKGEKMPKGFKDHPSKLGKDEDPPSGKTEQTDPKSKVEKIDRAGSSADDDSEERKRFREEAIAFLATMNIPIAADATDEELEIALDSVEGEE